MTQEQGATSSWKQLPLFAKSLGGVLTVEQCEAIKTDALALGLRPAEVVKRGASKQSRHRTSDAVRLPRTPEREWLVDHLWKKSEAVNAEFWKFAVTGIEGLQVLRYRPMQFFRWHFDTYGGTFRKLTCIVSLSSPQSYWRGGLEVRAPHPDRAVAPLQGAGTWFPTYVQHRATAPWWGERWVLVAWLTGPAWV
jgi:hypothetical protein